MGNTANRGLPYMENTDPLANVAAAIQALANALDVPRPSASVERTGAAQVIPNTALTLISFDTEVLDTDAMFTAPGTTLTVQTAGLWLVTGTLTFAAGGTSGRRRLELLAAGAMLVASEGAVTNGPCNLAASGIAQLDAGDVVQMQAYQASGGNLSTQTPANSPRLQMAWLGP